VHSDQLRRYREIAEKQYPVHEFIGVYLKTGWVERRDREACADAGYTLFNRELWLDVLVPHQGIDAVLDQYLAFLTGVDDEARYWLATVHDPEKANEALLHPHVQWAFVRDIVGHHEIFRGTNNSGRSWTQCVVHRVDLAPGRWETFLLRVDHRKPHRGAPLTAYVAIRASERLDKSDPEQRRAKVARLAGYQQVFHRVLEELRGTGCPLVAGKPHTDRVGNYESDVGIFFLDQNRVEDLVAWVPKVIDGMVAGMG